MVYYFAQNADIYARLKDGTWEEVGAAQEVSFEWNVEATELHKFGTIKRVDAARTNLSVNVTVKFAEFKIAATSGGDWFWKILNKKGWTAITDENGNDTSDYSISTDDTSSFPMFEIAGEFRPTDGSTTNYIYATAHDVIFKTFQWGGSLSEYIIENIEGTASDITYSTKKPYS